MRSLPAPAAHDASVTRLRPDADDACGRARPGRIRMRTFRGCPTRPPGRPVAPFAGTPILACDDTGLATLPLAPWHDASLRRLIAKKCGAGNRPAPHTQHQSLPDGPHQVFLARRDILSLHAPALAGSCEVILDPCLPWRLAPCPSRSKHRANGCTARRDGDRFRGIASHSCSSYPQLQVFQSAGRGRRHPFFAKSGTPSSADASPHGAPR